MKYPKGTFITVPNKQAMRSLSLGARAVFTEICDMADKNGLCFPSRNTLAKRILKTESTVDRYIAELVQNGFLKKTNRKSKDGVYTSNIYQIKTVIQSASVSTPVPNPEYTPVPTDDDLTVTNINSNHITHPPNPPEGGGRRAFVLQELQELEDIVGEFYDTGNGDPDKIADLLWETEDYRCRYVSAFITLVEIPDWEMQHYAEDEKSMPPRWRKKQDYLVSMRNWFRIIIKANITGVSSKAFSDACNKVSFYDKKTLKTVINAL